MRALPTSLSISSTSAGRKMLGVRGTRVLAGMLVLIALGACSVKRAAVDMVGDILSGQGSTFENDEDIELVGGALPFAIKLVEGLLAESPEHSGLLVSAARTYVLYSYAFVHARAERVAEVDLDEAKRQRARARQLYLRAFGYAMRALELRYPGLEARLAASAAKAMAEVRRGGDVEPLYWSAASLGLAIGASKGDISMLARLGEVEALLDRALAIDEAWDDGALHEFRVQWLAAQGRVSEPEALRFHYERALELSAGNRAGVHVAYAEASTVPRQARREFVALLEKALAVDIDAAPDRRLANALAQARARWLLGRVEELFL